MEEIWKYQKNSLGAFLLPVIPLVLGVGLAAALFSGAYTTFKQVALAVIVAPLAFAGGIALIRSSIRENKELRQQLEELEKSGGMQQLTADFQSARQMMKGKLRPGNQYIFRKHRAKLLEYTDVVQVYQKIMKKNFVETSRNLNAVLKNKDTIVLCELKSGGRSDEEMKQIIVHMCLHNPGILVGFKNPSRLDLASSAGQPARNPAVRFCPNCGKQLTGGEKFCSGCGRQL